MKHLLKHLFLLLFILRCSLAAAQSVSRTTTHIVEAGETAYSISRKYGLTKEELKDANPTIISSDYQIKAGSKLLIPGKDGIKTQKIKRNGEISIGVMLPLNKSSEGMAMVEYYRGILMACDVLKNENVNIHIHAWDLSKNSDLDKILKEKEAAECDVIFGPLYDNQVSKLADFANSNNIRLAIPFVHAQTEIEKNKNIYLLSEFNPAFTEKTCERFFNLFEKCNPIIIGCNDSKNSKGIFSSSVRKYLDKKDIKYHLTSIDSDIKSFGKAFRKNRNNVIILNSSNISKFKKVSEMIREVRKNNPEYKVSTIGFHEWFINEHSHKKELAENDVYIPTYFYYNQNSASTRKIEKDYFKYFKSSMMETMPKLAITGYDHAMFFLHGLNQYGDLFEGTKAQSAGRYIQMPVYLKKVSANGGYQNEAFMFIHYKNDNSIESIAY